MLRRINNKVGIIFCGVLTAFLLALSYPKFNLSFLAFFAFIPFTLALTNFQKKTSVALFSVFCGFLFYSLILYWIYFTCRAGNVSVLLSIFCWFVLSLILSLEWGLFGLLCSLGKNKNPLFPLYISLCWVIVEWFKVFSAHKLAWFPWFLAGYTQWNNPYLIQITSVTGVYGLSFAIVFIGSSLGYIISKKGFVNLRINKILSFLPSPLAGEGRQSRVRGKIEQDFIYTKTNILKTIFAPITVLLIIFAFGYLRIHNYKPDNSKKITFSLLQPNTDQYKKWTPIYENEIEQNLRSLAKKAAAIDPDIIIYPEAALPGYIEEEKWANLVLQIAKETKTYQLIGTVSERNYRHYISAFLFNEQGKNTGIYDKQHLVPFGEYIPLKFLTKYIGVLGMLGGFTKGSLQQHNLKFNDINLATGICYETIFTNSWREKVNKGADILVNLTNDGWYLNTAGPYQHFIPAVFRAVENNRPLIRCGNTGVSAYIDGLGRIVKQIKLNTQTILTHTATLPKNPKMAFYTKYGDIFLYFCILLWVCYVFVSRKFLKI